MLLLCVPELVIDVSRGVEIRLVFVSMITGGRILMRNAGICAQVSFFQSTNYLHIFTQITNTGFAW